MTISLAIIPILTILTGLLILLVPTLNGEDSTRIGTLLTIGALLELIHGFRRASLEDQKSAWSSAVISLGLGLLLFSAPLLVTQALKYFLAGWFGLDAVRCLSSAVRQSDHRSLRFRRAITGCLWAVIAAVAMLAGNHWLVWIIAVAAALRVLNSAIGMWISPLLTRESLREISSLTQALPDDPEIQSMAQRILGEEFARETVDRGWIVVYLGTLLAIHLGRMGLDRSALGIISPGFALAGDIFVALLIAFLFVAPLSFTTNTLLVNLEKRGWRWCISPSTPRLRIPRHALQWLLSIRLRQRTRIRLARCSYFNTFSRALQIGLPAAAILTATVPIWGMSWYFDTENWAAGIWNSWAEHRTDIWREAMALAVHSDKHESIVPGARLEIHPEGVAEGQDFAFLVIGDPGEGDASQLSLKSQILEMTRQPELKFVVISSDVIYPTGAMKDYESRFWLPFMGVTKPVYAIPGNHDWYDALEGFAATFLDPDSARKAMQARVEADNRLTSTTDQHIEGLIAEASRLQTEYRVPVQQQQLPYFQLQTETFALFAVDTGVARRIDPEQQQWLEESLVRARGKTKMVILGHPFFAGGRDQTTDDEDFRALRQLLDRHQVQIVMAGDTHDLEYYLEKPGPEGDQSPTLHFVNGGGGAYLSFGTTLDWPAEPVTTDWAVYPGRSQVETKIHATAPWWKRPAWFWVRKFSGWPFSAEWLSAAFDSNVAPFYQSFVVVYVEPSKQRIRLVPFDVHGPLTYADIMRSKTLGQLPGDRIVEWVIPMP
ncbi:MAG: metallophosphoesterase [Planctomycetia bacterium]